jgi:methylglyoxal synthase
MVQVRFLLFCFSTDVLLFTVIVNNEYLFSQFKNATLKDPQLSVAITSSGPIGHDNTVKLEVTSKEVAPFVFLETDV